MTDDAYGRLLRAMAQHYSVQAEHRRQLAREALEYAAGVLGGDVRDELDAILTKEKKR